MKQMIKIILGMLACMLLQACFITSSSRQAAYADAVNQTKDRKRQSDDILIQTRGYAA